MQYAHWGLCPVHSADFIKKITPDTLVAQLQRAAGSALDPTDPLLMRRGRPYRGGEQA